ncbi:beta-1,3-glucanase family protein [Gracilinema caldarium]|uniref:beta-1,3-glucanase family protein n=1 Tax=Gracilinema caldarium TaxID=215591 RepID=UPI0026F1F32D|nr:beta-1,3-glucanase family protein [Gracilinema caldarium]
MNKGLWWGIGISLLLSACSMGMLDSGKNLEQDLAARALTGTNGTLEITNMTGNAMTVTWKSGVQVSYARLYVSEGNGTGLVFAAKDMNYSNGVYSYTLSHPTFTSGAKIYLTVLKNQNGIETCIPQGILSQTTSWAQITYGDASLGPVSSGSTGSGDLIEGAIYKITAACSGKALDVAEVSKNPGANIHQWEFVQGENQKWKLVSSGDGYWYIESVWSGLVLDGDAWGTADGTNIIQWNRGNNQANQKWKIEPNGDGTYRLTNLHANKVLDVSGASTANGANVQLWAWNASSAQRWTFTRLDSTSGTGGSSTTSLINLQPNMEMTIQFVNNTRGTYSNDRIWICVIGRNQAQQFCYLKPDGTLVPITANQTSTDWSYRLSDIAGFQVPQNMSSARLYISMDNRVVMRGIVDGAGNIGIVQPDLNNPADPNSTLIFDWIEYTVAPGAFWGNTTQVDQFGFPIVMEMFNDSGVSYASFKKVGISKTREEIFSAFERLPQTEFRTLVKRPYRIIAPCKGEFRVGRTYGTYMQSYVDEVWNYYKTNTLTFNHPLGTFNGRVLADGRFEFTRTSDGGKFYIARKPNNDEVFEGSGVLASGNTVELAIQAQICAAFNRHIVQDPANWANPNAYYQAGPANYYAKFWHDNSINPLAYGFCYDDVADQSSLIESHAPRGLVLTIGW